VRSDLDTRLVQWNLYVHQTVAEQAWTWEQQVESLEQVERVGPDALDRLCALLKPENDIDSYVTSPTYYLFTGRKGRWIYRDGEAFVPFCWHPNVAGQVLVFPQRGKAPINLRLMRQIV
jgi:hypothetical protein